MAEIIPPGFAECVLSLKHGDVARAAAVTWGIDMNAQTGSVAMANALRADFDVSFSGNIDTGVTIGPLTLRVGQDGGEALVFQSTVLTTGQNAGDSLPSNCALLLKKQTGRGGRRGRGRMFIPWILGDVSVDDTGNLTTATRTNRQAQADAFIAALDSIRGTIQPTPMVLLHSPSDPDTENPSEPGLPNEVTSLLVDGIIGTQRRRLAR